MQNLEKTPDEPEIDLAVEDAVIVEEDKPEAAAAPEPAPAPQPDPAEEVRAQLLAAQQAAQQANAERDRMRAIAAQKEQEARAASSDAQLQQYNMLVQTMQSTERQLETLEEKAQQALEVGDGRAHAKAMREIAALQTKMEWYADAKVQIEEQAEAQRQAAERAAQTPRQTPVRQQSAAPSNLTPESQRWLAAHPDVLRDPQKTAAVVLAHHVAVDQGWVQDSPAYFAFIEQRLGYRQVSDSRPTQRQTYAAPVSRDVGTTPTNNPNRVKLTAEQVAFAEQMGERMGLKRDAAIKRYAQGVIKAQERARNR